MTDITRSDPCSWLVVGNSFPGNHLCVIFLTADEERALIIIKDKWMSATVLQYAWLKPNRSIEEEWAHAANSTDYLESHVGKLVIKVLHKHYCYFLLDSHLCRLACGWLVWPCPCRSPPCSSGSGVLRYYGGNSCTPRHFSSLTTCTTPCWIDTGGRGGCSCTLRRERAKPLWYRQGWGG